MCALHVYFEGKALRDSTSASVREMTNAWIRYNMEAALRYKASHDEEAAYFLLGLLKHALQDGTSPMYRDPTTGEELGWDKNASFSVKLRHAAGESFNPGPGSESYRATRDARTWFNTGHIPASDLIQRYGIDTKHGIAWSQAHPVAPSGTMNGFA